MERMLSERALLRETLILKLRMSELATLGKPVQSPSWWNLFHTFLLPAHPTVLTTG